MRSVLLRIQDGIRINVYKHFLIEAITLQQSPNLNVWQDLEEPVWQTEAGYHYLEFPMPLTNQFYRIKEDLETAP